MTQIDPIVLYVLRQHDVIDADTLRTIADTKGVRVATVERVALVMGFGGMLLVLSFFVIETIMGTFGDAPLAKSSGLLYLCAFPWIIWFSIKRRRFGHVAATLLKHERCPHCGYNLHMLPVDEADGATICPECGCAWKLEGGAVGGEAGDDSACHGHTVGAQRPADRGRCVAGCRACMMLLRCLRSP